MKWIGLLLILAILPLFGQGEGAPVDAPNPEAAETEDQKNTREVSLIDLREADARLNAEREAITKRERRLSILMEALENQNATISAREESVQKALRDYQATKEDVTVPGDQVAHWESRNPNVAARDFAVLHRNEPKVAVGLVRKMKKKKSAALIDEVSKLTLKENGVDGKKIAAELHEAIGTGVIDQ